MDTLFTYIHTIRATWPLSLVQQQHKKNSRTYPLLTLLFLYMCSWCAYAEDLPQKNELHLFDCINTALVHNTAMRRAAAELIIKTSSYNDTKRRVRFDGSLEANRNEQDKENVIQTRTNKTSAQYGITIPTVLYGDLKLSYTQTTGEDMNMNQFVRDKATDISLQFPLIRSGMVMKKLETMSQILELESAENQYFEQREAIIAQVAQNFFSLYLKKKELESIEKQYAFRTWLYEIIKNKYEAGSFSKIEIDRIQLEILQTKQSLQQAQHSLHDMEKFFFAFISIAPQPYAMDIALSSFSLVIPEINDRLKDTIVRTKFEFYSIQKTKDLFALEKAHTNCFNQATIFSQETIKEHDDYMTTVGVKIPLQDIIHVHEHKKQLARQIEQQDVALQQAHNQLDEKLTALKTSFEEYRFNMEIAQRSIELAKKIVEIDTLNYERGTIQQEKLLDSQQRYQDALYNYEKYTIDAIMAKIEVDRLLGNLRKGGYLSWLR